MSAGRSPTTSRARAPRQRVAGLFVVVALLAGCSSEADAPSPAPPDLAGPSSADPAEAQLDLSGLPVPRTDVCDLLGHDDVERALAAPVTDTAHYGNGEEFEVTPGRVDISHEHGCVFAAGDGATARVWIFARPVLRSEADTFVRRTRRGRDCAFPESLAFGAPGVTSVCELPGRPSEGGPAFRARLEGLFGDTWVGCEVSEPRETGTPLPVARADVLQRAERWCTEVVTTISAS